MKNILKIQELERQIRKLQSTATKSSDNEIYEQLKKNRKVLLDKMNSLDDLAGVVAKQFQQIAKRYEQLNAKSEIVSKQKPEKTGVSNIGSLVEEANYLTSELAKLEQKMRELNDKINRIDSEFNVSMISFREMKQKQDIIKKKIDEKQANISPEVAEKEAQIKKLEASVDKELYQKYKSLRDDNIFPVFVPLRDNRCGACQMVQSLNFIQKLKQKGMLPCEECRRIILSDD